MKGSMRSMAAMMGAMMQSLSPGNLVELLKGDGPAGGGRRQKGRKVRTGIPGSRGGTMGRLAPFAMIIRTKKQPMRCGVWPRREKE